ncbi:cilia- and flagella-associated protein 53 isoform X2 [Electrophorus electricus]|uniref:cilia- and flagella-associated protein 53 isoform X2 n=1 Tax=Electrophorus electricus TaxID=8005 RepID=UPI0015CF82E1|nr:cilia- and flagella-associated protein 53 isoform X2 [Electrophorus electricus]
MRSFPPLTSKTVGQCDILPLRPRFGSNMLIGQRNRTQCREFTGPTPHSVAVRARYPSSRPSDYLILERRKQEAARNNVLAFTKDQSACDFRMLWERNTERQMVSATIDRRVQEAMEQYQISIDERRDRLREMLENEEREYLREMKASKETVLEKQAKMRERAKYLLEKREMERQKFVADKLDQLFSERSEELRALQMHRRQGEVCAERATQIRTQEETSRLRREEELLFAQLWENDRLAKEERNNHEVQRQQESNLQQLAFLRAQMEAVKQQRLQAKHLKEEEAQLLCEQREALRLEEQREHRHKLLSQESRRRQLDRSLRLKMKRVVREQQEELALDMSILEKLLAQENDEKKGETLRKLELREEQRKYRQYLAEQLEEQKRQEAETEQVIEAELQKTWAHRAEQWRLEKEARDGLMKDVLQTLHLQIQQKLQWNNQKQAELAKERDELNSKLQQNKLLDEQEKTRFCISSICVRQNRLRRRRSSRWACSTKRSTIRRCRTSYPGLSPIALQFTPSGEGIDQPHVKRIKMVCLFLTIL